MLTKVYSFVIAFFLMTGSMCAQEVEWLTWHEAYEKQQEDPKKIFIDIYTDWCGWCKKMDQSTFKDSTIVKVLNEDYYPVKFDAERTDTIDFNGHTFVNPNPDGKRSTHTFAATLLENKLSYPSFAILDEQFNRVHLIKGFQRPKKLTGILLFFGTNEHQRYLQYLNEQNKRSAENSQGK